jgi:hypothetical protein
VSTALPFTATPPRRRQVPAPSLPSCRRFCKRKKEIGKRRRMKLMKRTRKKEAHRTGQGSRKKKKLTCGQYGQNSDQGCISNFLGCGENKENKKKRKKKKIELGSSPIDQIQFLLGF